MMTREELASALEMLPVNDPDWRWDLPLTDIVAAARMQLSLMPEVCGTCGGRGWTDSADPESVSAPICPTCHGSGKVYPQETVETIAEALRQVTLGNINASLTENRYPLIAVAVLDALGETE